MTNYEILVQNHIDPKRIREFEGLACEHMTGGKTLISGKLKDQSELFAVLSKIQNMNLILISVQKMRKEPEE